MNIKDIKVGIITKSDRFGSFYIKEMIESDNPLMREIRNFAPDFNWNVVNAFLKEKFGKNVHNEPRYFLAGIYKRGNEINGLELCKNIENGSRFIVDYKELRFFMDCLADGEIVKVDLNSSWVNGELFLCESMEEYYLQVLSVIKRDKRHMMTGYNKEIRELKQKYKKELKKYNDVLKGE